VSSGTLKGQETPLGERAEFEGGLIELAPRTFAWVQPNGGLGESNAGLVIGDDAALLIDTLWDERLTATMLAGMEEALGGIAITRVLNTHGDGDHWYGNGLVADATEIIASAAAAEQMREEPPSMLTRLAPVGKLASLAGRVPLLPGGGRARGLAGFSEMLSRYDFDGISPRLPTRTFTGSLTLKSDGREIEVTEVGPAHTPGDAIVYLPYVGVVFAGDILFNGVTPIMWAGPVDNWIAALELIDGLAPEAVVGGHGPPGGVAEVRALRDYWTHLAEAVGGAPGEDPGELTERLLRSEDWATAPWAGWRNPERTLVNVARIQATAAGGATEIGTLERIGLISAMGALAAKLAR
jgi:glyoxylase-like metal-dependent hydrolase (beta-lactamase superfamily II)